MGIELSDHPSPPDVLLICCNTLSRTFRIRTVSHLNVLLLLVAMCFFEEEVSEHPFLNRGQLTGLYEAPVTSFIGGSPSRSRSPTAWGFLSPSLDPTNPFPVLLSFFSLSLAADGQTDRPWGNLPAYFANEKERWAGLVCFLKGRVLQGKAVCCCQGNFSNLLRLQVSMRKGVGR